MKCLSPALLLLLLASCSEVPKATPDDIAIRDQWAVKVPAEFRDQVYAEADRHTGWAERRKLLYEVDRFQHYVKSAEVKERAGRSNRATSKAASTGPSTRRVRRAATTSSAAE